MEVVGHYDEFVQGICTAVTIVKDSFDQDFGIFGDLEDSAALPAFCGDEIRGAWYGSVLRC